MSLLDMLSTVFLGPLKLIFELIFSYAWDFTKHPGTAIVLLSLVMNVILLPLYRRADAIQEAARDKEKEMRDTVRHIKATFSGDERMMILQAYYRENHYNPLSVLSGTLSLMLEIPFFMAAYQFLSGVEAFQGLSFGPISDLSAPDGLLNIGGFTLNLLPVIMTVINVVSTSLYLKGFPLKDKIQLYGMALFFLVFLYSAPAALVLYWTLNNTFSLFKTLYNKLPNGKKLFSYLFALIGGAMILFATNRVRRDETILLMGMGFGLQLPWLLPYLRKLPMLQRPGKVKKPTAKPSTGLFLAGALFLSILVGLLIPSTYISASVQEYIDPYYFYSPVWYVAQTLCLSIGLFLVWMGVFYWLASPKFKVILSRTVWILCLVMLVNYMFFGTDLGVISPDLQYTESFTFSANETLINTLSIIGLIAGGLLLVKFFPKAVTSVLVIAAITLSYMGIVNMNKISTEAEETRIQIRQSADRLPAFTLSQEGYNVVVIMLDRGIGPFVPYLMDENPELEKQFDGFTYYENTISYGGFTNFTTPALFGGYDYTPVNLNLRTEESLADKHNEALKVLPTVFGEEGYQVTTIDPSYAGYKWIPDLSIFDGMENVEAYAADGRFNDYASHVQAVETRQRNFFLFSLMKALPVDLQSSLYHKGDYRALPKEDTTVQINNTFMNAYYVMENMDAMTEISGGSQNTLMILRSNLTHDTMVLQEPDYTPSTTVDNSAYHTAEGKVITDGENTLTLSTEKTLSHYHANMAALMQLGEWFDYLRKNDVYDNTRIIIVSDHGRNLGLFGEDLEPQGRTMESTEFYMSMLLVKDFNQEGFTVCEDYMTNADVPSLATEGLIEDPVNPFTGNPLTDDAKYARKQYVIASQQWDIKTNNGNQFLPSMWATVTGDIYDVENWTFYTDETYLPPELNN